MGRWGCEALGGGRPDAKLSGANGISIVVDKRPTGNKDNMFGAIHDTDSADTSWMAPQAKFRTPWLPSCGSKTYPKPRKIVMS